MTNEPGTIPLERERRHRTRDSRKAVRSYLRHAYRHRSSGEPATLRRDVRVVRCPTTPWIFRSRTSVTRSASIPSHPRGLARWRRDQARVGRW
jgi:hypothetical protein